MKPEIFLEIQSKLSSLNSKQRAIASSLILNERDYQFSGGTPQVYITVLSTGQTHDFISYVKALCGCDD